MDRIYVKHQQKVPVHQLGLDKWRDVVIRNKQLSERLLGTLLDLVRKERTGDVIDRALMRSITMVSLYVSYAKMLTAHSAELTMLWLNLAWSQSV